MASLGKITYKPLIDHLKAHQSDYDQLLIQYELVHGEIPVDNIMHWMAKVVQPIIEVVSNADEIIVSKITKVLFQNILQLSPSGVLVDYEEELVRTWRLSLVYQEIVCRQPKIFFNVVNAVLSAIMKHNPKRISLWLVMMEDLSYDKLDLQAFKAGGKVAAWMCGLSHLREQTKEAYTQLEYYSIEKLSKHNPLEFSIKECLHNPWLKPPAQVLKLGGFIGLNNGMFQRPPVIIQDNDMIVASDGETKVGVFFDAFGSIILNNIGQGELKDYETPLLANKKMEYQDISSSLVNDQVSVFTRSSAHYVFIQFEV